MVKRAIISADDFGMSQEVNEAIEEAHCRGLLSTTSLMVSGEAVDDAIRRAKRLPDLKVGLHLVVIEGPATLSHSHLPLITNQEDWFSSDQLRLGIDYFFPPEGRRELHKEIAAQFSAFSKTGLVLDHANAHKHMHLHPTVGRMMIDVGKNYGLDAVRIPYEPAGPLKATGDYHDTMGAALLRYWTNILRMQAKKAHLKTNQYSFGIAWSGHMTEQRLIELAPHIPDGLSDIYFHPATHKNALMQKLMPDYEHAQELRTLLSPAFKESLQKADVQLSTWRRS